MSEKRGQKPPHRGTCKKNISRKKRRATLVTMKRNCRSVGKRILFKKKFKEGGGGKEKNQVNTKGEVLCSLYVGREGGRFQNAGSALMETKNFKSGKKETTRGSAANKRGVVGSGRRKKRVKPFYAIRSGKRLLVRGGKEGNVPAET